MICIVFICFIVVIVVVYFLLIVQVFIKNGFELEVFVDFGCEMVIEELLFVDQLCFLCLVEWLIEVVGIKIVEVCCKVC